MYRLWMWFIAFYRLSDYAVCEMSKGKGIWNNYHDYPDDIHGQPDHFRVLKCKRCGKEFMM